MRKTFTAGLVALTTFAGAAALWTGVAAAQSSTTTDEHGRTFSFDVQFSPFFIIDFGTSGVRSVSDITQSDPSRGDVTVFQDTLLRSGHEVGHDGGSCTVTSVNAAATPPTPPIQLACNATFDLPGGTITTQGLASNAPDKHLVITGGTRAYLHAAGEVIVTENGDENNTGTAVFHLAR